MLPWSVIPMAGISRRWASATIGLTFAAPSSIEYSVWLCRCTNEALIGWPVYWCAPTVPGVSHDVSSVPGAQTGQTGRIVRHRPTKTPVVSLDSVIELNGVTKTFGGGIAALRDVSLSFTPGFVGAIVGQNGAGQPHEDK